MTIINEYEKSKQDAMDRQLKLTIMLHKIYSYNMNQSGKQNKKENLTWEDASIGFVRKLMGGYDSLKLCFVMANSSEEMKAMESWNQKFSKICTERMKLYEPDVTEMWQEQRQESCAQRPSTEYVLHEQGKIQKRMIDSYGTTWYEGRLLVSGSVEFDLSSYIDW